MAPKRTLYGIGNQQSGHNHQVSDNNEKWGEK